MTNLDGRRWVVTGANGGIGKEIVLGLARLKASVALVCRDEGRGLDALESISQILINEGLEPDLSLWIADFASLQSIAELVSRLKAHWNRLDGIVNNAAIIPPKRQTSLDGYELQFAVNHLAYYAFAVPLVPLLALSDQGRLINVASNAHFRGNISFDDLQSERAYKSRPVYCFTKLANVLFTHEMSKRLSTSSVTANALHPGVIATGLLARYFGPLGGMMSRVFGSPKEEGARTPLYLASSIQVSRVSGRYFDRCQERVPSSQSRDASIAMRLWEITQQLTGIELDELEPLS